MNTPRSKKPVRYSPKIPENHGGRDGVTKSGLHNEEMAHALGYLATYWPHIEEQMIDVLGDLIGDRRPARQIFRTIVNQKTRLEVMKALLQHNEVNKEKSGLYDQIIDEFTALNAIRNKYLHGLWYTHENGRVYLSEADADDFAFFQAREVGLKEIEGVIGRMGELFRLVVLRHRPELRTSPEKP